MAAQDGQRPDTTWVIPPMCCGPTIHYHLGTAGKSRPARQTKGAVLKLLALLAVILALPLAVGNAFARVQSCDLQCEAPGSPTASDYSLAVARICAGALLFDRAHEMGTRAGALAVARDIRASTAGRLSRVAAVPAPAELGGIGLRWISLQRRLAASYARAWVRIYETIDAAHTPVQRAALPERLRKLVHAPDPLRLASRRLELRLHVPDCTGG